MTKKIDRLGQWSTELEPNQNELYENGKPCTNTQKIAMALQFGKCGKCPEGF